MFRFQVAFWLFFAAAVAGAIHLAVNMHQPFAAVALWLMAMGCAVGAYACMEK